jgi:hypothetical protein
MVREAIELFDAELIGLEETRVSDPLADRPAELGEDN